MFNEVHKSSCCRPNNSVSALCLEQGQRWRHLITNHEREALTHLIDSTSL
jgi:hypothetical protein